MNALFAVNRFASMAFAPTLAIRGQMVAQTRAGKMATSARIAVKRLSSSSSLTIMAAIPYFARAELTKCRACAARKKASYEHH